MYTSSLKVGESSRVIVGVEYQPFTCHILPKFIQKEYIRFW